MRKFPSLMDELNQIGNTRDRSRLIESRAEHVIASAINLIEQIEQQYDEDTARDLSARLINSIRGKDSLKFSRGIRRAANESKDS